MKAALVSSVPPAIVPNSADLGFTPHQRHPTAPARTDQQQLMFEVLRDLKHSEGATLAASPASTRRKADSAARRSPPRSNTQREARPRTPGLRDRGESRTATVAIRHAARTSRAASHR